MEAEWSKPIEMTEDDKNKTDTRKLKQGFKLKVNVDAESLDFMDRPCNCSRPCKVNGACVFKECTQDTFKAQMTQHFNDVTWLMPSTKPNLPEDDK
eukprot:9809801-Ditylum_brightwellii.AAC.1